jgi:chromate transporter
MEFLLLFYEYFKIGLFTIGGGYAMLPAVRQVVLQRCWMTNDQLIGFVGIAESTPGPFAINLATFVGMEVGKSTSLGIFGGFLGATLATFAVVLPSLVIIIIVTRLFDKFRTNRYVQGALYGITPVVVGLVLSSALTVTVSVVLPNFSFSDINAASFAEFRLMPLILLIVLFPASRLKINHKKIHPIWLILLSAGVGIVVG